MLEARERKEQSTETPPPPPTAAVTAKDSTERLKIDNNNDEAKEVTPEQQLIEDLTSRLAIVLKVSDDHEHDRYIHRTHSSIGTLRELKAELEGLCRTVFNALGKQQKEAAYQRALGIELQLSGVTVFKEVSVDVMYRGHKISSRRLDLLLVLADGTRAIVEMKAIKTLSKAANNAQQIEYYMDIFGVEHGFLVNFPHDAGFPPVEREGGGAAVFRQELICGVTAPLSDVQLRERKDVSPEVVYFHRVA